MSTCEMVAQPSKLDKESQDVWRDLCGEAAKLRISLTFWIVLNLDVDQMDVETAFLEGDLKESKRIHLRFLLGMNLEKDECLEINRKGMHGFVQSARVHGLKMTAFLCSEEIGFQKSDADQCLFHKKGKHGPIFFVVHQ